MAQLAKYWGGAPMIDAPDYAKTAQMSPNIFQHGYRSGVRTLVFSTSKSLWQKKFWRVNKDEAKVHTIRYCTIKSVKVFVETWENTNERIVF